MIKCNDAGVRAVEATAKGSVEDWLKRVDREKELMLLSIGRKCSINLIFGPHFMFR